MFQAMINKIIDFIAKNNLSKFDVMALRAGIPSNKLKDFWVWALGDDYKKLLVKDMPTRWNNLHASEMMILPSHSVVQSIRLMALIFLTK